MSASRRWLVFAALGAVVVLAAGWLLLVKPQHSKVSSLHTQTDQQNQANSLLLTQIAALQSEQKELPQQQLALQKFTTEVPDSPDEPTLIRLLTTAAQRANVELTSITPGTPAVVTAAAAVGGATPLDTGTAAAPAAELDSMTVTLTVVGSYANVEAFFAQVEHLPRAMLVSAFTVCPEVPAGVGSACGAPQPPTNKPPLPSDVGATLTSMVFFSPPPAVMAATTTSTLGATSTTGATTTGTTGTTSTGGTPPDVTGPSTTGAAAGNANQLGGG